MAMASVATQPAYPIIEAQPATAHKTCVRIDRTFRPWLAVSKDATRHGLTHVEIDETGTAFASDGHILIVIPEWMTASVGEGDVQPPGPIFFAGSDLDFYFKTQKKSRNDPQVIDVPLSWSEMDNGENRYTLEGWDRDSRPVVIQGRADVGFPAVEQVLKQGKPAGPGWASVPNRFGLNVELLYRLTRALGAPDSMTKHCDPAEFMIEVGLPKPGMDKHGQPPDFPDHWFIVRRHKAQSGDAFGIIMPVRLDMDSRLSIWEKWAIWAKGLK
jgi:hypothetical protein